MTELLDVFSADGEHLGTADREEVHRRGLWHRCFHLWVAIPEGVLLQRRSSRKVSWPSALDATAAGHLEAGEDVLDGVREVREELGVDVDPADLEPLGVFTVDEPQVNGVRNREFQHVHLLRSTVPLAEWTGFDREELAALVAIAPGEFARLVALEAPEVDALRFDGTEVAPVRVRHDELVPAPALPAVAAALSSA